MIKVWNFMEYAVLFIWDKLRYFFTNFYKHIFTWNVFENLLSGLIVVVLGYVVLVIPRRKKLFNFFGFDKNKKLNIYVSTLFVTKPSAGTVTHKGDIISFAGPVIPEYEFKMIPVFSNLFNLITTGDDLISAVLNRWLLGDVDIKYPNAPQTLIEMEFCNLICVGGPAANSLTDYYMNERLMTELGFDANNVGIEIKRGEDKGKIIGRHDSQYDYAILEKTFDKENGNIVFIAAGFGFAGTMAAANYLVKEWRFLAREFNDDYFTICLRVPWYHLNSEGYKTPEVIFLRRIID